MTACTMAQVVILIQKSIFIQILLQAGTVKRISNQRINGVSRFVIK